MHIKSEFLKVILLQSEKKLPRENNKQIHTYSRQQFIWAQLFKASLA